MSSGILMPAAANCLVSTTGPGPVPQHIRPWIAELALTWLSCGAKSVLAVAKVSSSSKLIPYSDALAFIAFQPASAKAFWVSWITAMCRSPADFMYCRSRSATVAAVGGVMNA